MGWKTGLRRRSLAAKLTIALGLLILPALAVGTAGFVFLDGVSKESQAIAEEGRAGSALAARVSDLLLDARAYAALGEDGVAEFTRTKASIDDGLARLRLLDSSGAREHAAAAEASWAGAAEAGLDLLGGASADPALRARFDGSIRSVQRELGLAREALLADNVSETRALERHTVTLGVVVVVALGLSVAIAIIGGRRVYRSIVEPVRELRQAADRLGAIDLSTRATVTGDDELGRLGEEFNRMAARLERANAALTHLSLHDALTDLPNRALFLNRCEHALQRLRRQVGVVAVLFIDLDDFSRINDSLGHAFGDRLLILAGERLRGALRAGDTVARLGGDEFGVLLEDLEDQGDAYLTARRVVDSLGQAFVIDGTEAYIRASVGLAFSVDGLEDEGTLLRNADLARYAAKRAGGGRFEAFRPELHRDAVESLNLEVDLRHAVENGEITVVYQPIVALDTGRIAGVEALVRWAHPQRGLVSPNEFIPVAEAHGLIDGVGREVLRLACQDLAHMRRLAGRSLFVAVNVSPRQFRSREFVAETREALREAGIEPAGLLIEVTESALMEDPDTAETQLRELKALGVRIALDDFGTGHSSLSYIARFPLDVIKIDRSFVSSPHGKSLAQARLTETVLALAETLNLVSVAEGAETLEQARELAAMGCQMAQGYLFAKPDKRDAVAALLADRVGESYRRRQLAA